MIDIAHGIGITQTAIKEAMMRKIRILVVLGVLCLPLSAWSRDYIRAVGSSTVYPFITIVAEEFGRDQGFKTPVVESIGTGGGFKLFCEGAGNNTPDISNASRPIKDSEKELCQKNGVVNYLELMIGFDGIVLANLRGAYSFNFTTKQLFLALAKQVPVNGKLVKNPYKKWSDIEITLPPFPIVVYGPPPSSGTRDAFNELVLEHECKKIPEYKTQYPDTKEMASKCKQYREDGAFIEAGENDSLIVQKLVHNKYALGIFGYSFLEENRNVLQASKIAGIEPEIDTINDHSYGISRPLYIYVKLSHLKAIKGLGLFLRELFSDKALGDFGYVTDKGLVPLPHKLLVEQQQKIAPYIPRK